MAAAARTRAISSESRTADDDDVTGRQFEKEKQETEKEDYRSEKMGTTTNRIGFGERIAIPNESSADRDPYQGEHRKDSVGTHPRLDYTEHRTALRRHPP